VPYPYFYLQAILRELELALPLAGDQAEHFEELNKSANGIILVKFIIVDLLGLTYNVDGDKQGALANKCEPSQASIATDLTTKTSTTALNVEINSDDTQEGDLIDDIAGECFSQI
jgi:hypothetical protein